MTVVGAGCVVTAIVGVGVAVCSVVNGAGFSQKE